MGEQGLILRTTDGGAGWQGVTSGVKDGLRAVSFSGVNGISAGDSQDILYSTDSGSSWQIGQSGFFGPPLLGAHMLSSTAGFVAGQNAVYPFLFDNKEGGCTDVFFFDVNTGVVSGIVFDGQGAIARTTDGSTNWSTSLFDHGLQGVDFLIVTSGFAVGSVGEILHSTDAGITWTRQTSGTSANLNDVSFASDALRGIAVGDSGTILWAANGGGPAPTPTPTSTASPTPSATPTVTPSVTPRPTPTPRVRPTPRPRPTAQD